MTRFIIRRLGWSLLCLWFVMSTTFVILYAIPGDPARAIVGPHADPATVAEVRRQLCLDCSFPEQYGRYVGRIVTGDLGTSFRTQRPVAQIVGEHIWATVQLAFGAIFLQVLLGIPLGVISAVRRNRPTDTAAMTIALLGQSAPTFFLGPLFMFVLSYQLGLFPVSGYGEAGFLDRLWHLFLPAFTLAVGGIAYYARLVRGEMVEVLQEDYVRTARAKGLAPRVVVLHHGMRNALVPVVTLIGLDLGVLLGGAVVTEYIFGWPGLGREAVNAILNVDLPLILGIVLFSAVAILVANILVDIAYAALDPRVRLE
jgi:peptide/nickel transport system permease protein